jgi:hypothetical protein
MLLRSVYELSSSPVWLSPLESITLHLLYIPTSSGLVALHTHTYSSWMHSIVKWYMIERCIGYWDIFHDTQYFLPDVCACVCELVCAFTFHWWACVYVNVHQFVFIESMDPLTYTLPHTDAHHSIYCCCWCRWYCMYARLPILSISSPPSYYYYLNLRSPHPLLDQIHSMSMYCIYCLFICCCYYEFRSVELNGNGWLLDININLLFTGK